MSCPECDALRHEIDRLMGREAYASDPVDTIKRRFRITPAEARILYRLFTANGKPITSDKLESVASKRPCETSTDLARIYIHRIRAAIGSPAIETVYSYGYRLTQSGQQLVASALQDAPVAA